MTEVTENNRSIKNKSKKIIKTSNIVIVSNDARFARMLELEFLENGHNCRNFNITGNINSRDTYYFSEIINYCFFSQSNLIILVLSRLEKYSQIFSDFISLVQKVSDIQMILISCDNYALNFIENKAAKNNVILVKRPFNTDQFLKEIKLFLGKMQKNKTESNNIIYIGELSIDDTARSVKYKDELLDLTKKEYDLLIFMAQRKGEALDRKDIFTEVWGFDYIGNTNTVDVYMNRLRAKIDRKYQSKYIHTIRGTGYMLKNR